MRLLLSLFCLPGIFLENSGDSNSNSNINGNSNSNSNSNGGDDGGDGKDNRWVDNLK